jgi:hypothetical protein
MTTPQGSILRIFDYRNCRISVQALPDIEIKARFRANWVVKRNGELFASGSTFGSFVTTEQALVSAEQLAKHEIDDMLPRRDRLA